MAKTHTFQLSFTLLPMVILWGLLCTPARAMESPSFLLLEDYGDTLFAATFQLQGGHLSHSAIDGSSPSYTLYQYGEEEVAPAPVSGGSYWWYRPPSPSPSPSSSPPPSAPPPGVIAPVAPFAPPPAPTLNLAPAALPAKIVLPRAAGAPAMINGMPQRYRAAPVSPPAAVPRPPVSGPGSPLKHASSPRVKTSNGPPPSVPVRVPVRLSPKAQAPARALPAPKARAPARALPNAKAPIKEAFRQTPRRTFAGYGASLLFEAGRFFSPAELLLLAVSSACAIGYFRLRRRVRSCPQCARPSMRRAAWSIRPLHVPRSAHRHFP